MGGAKKGFELAQKTGKQDNQNGAKTEEEDDSWWDGTLDFFNFNSSGWEAEHGNPPR